MIRKVTGFAAMLALVVMLWGDAAPLSGREEKKLSAEERKTLAKEAAELDARAVKLYSAGKGLDAVALLEKAWAIRVRLYPQTEFADGHPDLAESLNNLAVVLQTLARADKAFLYYEKALAMTSKLYPESKFPDGHPDLAVSLNNLGFVLWSLGQADKALPHFEKALAMRTKLYPESKFPDGHPDLARSLNNLGFALHSLGKADKALPYFEKALAMSLKRYRESKFPDGHPDLALSLSSMGLVLQSLGKADKAVPYHEKALAMYSKLFPESKFPDGHPDLARSLNNLGNVLGILGRTDKALPHFEKALGISSKLFPESKFPDGHPDLAMGLNNMGFVLESLGMADKALLHYEKAVVMFSKLYPESKFPDGHPDLALSLSGVGFALHSLGKADKALPYFEKALAMSLKRYRESKFPDGHPDLALSLNSMGSVLQSLGKADKAVPYHEKALAMYSKLFPESKFSDGHPELAASLNNMGSVLQSLGKADKAMPYHEKALAMYSKLFPESKFSDGHPKLAASLHNLGSVLESLDKTDKALPYYEKALTMYSALAKRETATASESSALAYLRQKPRSRDLFVSASLDIPDTSTRSYTAVWNTRVPGLQLMLRRSEAAVVARSSSEKAQQTWQRLGEVRRSLGWLSANPPKDLMQRDRELVSLQAEQERLETTMNTLLPQLKEHELLAKRGPEDLLAALPVKSAFVDMVRYAHGEKGKFKEWRYLGFVLTPKGKVQRITFDADASNIEKAVDSWRVAISQNKGSPSTSLLREKLWSKIEKALPKDTDTVYLCLDGDLARLPFAALPGAAKDSILLEKYAFATVPSGQWLLQQLAKKPESETRSSFVLGGVDFGEARVKGDFGELPASQTEAKTIAAFLGDKSPLLGKEATVSAVRKRMGEASIAHLATHAYFDVQALIEDHKRQEQERTSDASRLAMELQTGSRRGEARVVVGVQNPLGFVGIALAGINERNDPKAKVDGNGILTGLDILELPLEKMQLCVLSACETGLGGWSEQDGVAGLHRALHVAGCRNVVGSLWNVNDSATAALMRVFYHELLINKRPALQALREAQLTIYRHPERIKALAGERGKIDFDDTVKLGSTIPPAKVDAKKANVRLWAAFALSGPGN